MLGVVSSTISCYLGQEIPPSLKGRMEELLVYCLLERKQLTEYQGISELPPLFLIPHCHTQPLTTRTIRSQGFSYSHNYGLLTLQARPLCKPIGLSTDYRIPPLRFIKLNTTPIQCILFLYPITRDSFFISLLLAPNAVAWHFQ